MKNKKIKKFIGLISIIIIIIIGFITFYQKSKTDQLVFKSNNFILKDNKIEIVEVDRDNFQTKNQTDKKNNLIYTEDVLLYVNDKRYSTYLNEGDTVYDVMNRIKEDGGLSFEGKNYPSLGFFITKVNEIKNGDSKYLIYYVNNKQAQVGVSNYVLKKGDIINWKLE